MKINIPRNDDEAREVADVATMNGWALAGYVASQVTLSNQGVALGKAKTSLSSKEFAAKGIRGLRSKDTVQLYVERWRDAGLPMPEPGQTVDVGDREWPPTGGTDWQRAQKDPERRQAIQRAADEEGARPAAVARVMGSPKAVAAAIKADPKVREAARRTLVATDAAREAHQAEVEARIIADGGRIPTPEEVDPPVEGFSITEAAAGAIEDQYRDERRQQREAALFETAEQAIRALTEAGPWSLDSVQGRRIQDMSFRLMDFITNTAGEAAQR